MTRLSLFSGKICLAIPWVVRDNILELVVIPSLAIVGITGMALSLTSLLTYGCPSYGYGLWAPVLFSVIAAISSASSFIWGSLALPIDMKLWEYVSAVGISIAVTGVVTSVDSFSGWAFRLGATVFISSVLWWNGTIAGLLASRFAPPPDENLIIGRNGGRCDEAKEIVSGARIRKWLYGGAEAVALLKGCRRFVLQVLTFVGIFSALYAQYHSVQPSDAVWAFCKVSIAFSVFGLISLLYLAANKTRYTLAKTNGVIISEKSFHPLHILTIKVFAGICFLSIVIPANYSPLAREDFDGLAHRINRVMDAFIRNLFSFVYKDRPGSINLASGTRGLSISSISQTVASNPLIAVVQLVVYISLLILAIWTTYTIIKLIKNRIKLIGLFLHKTERGQEEKGRWVSNFWATWAARIHSLLVGLYNFLTIWPLRLWLTADDSVEDKNYARRFLRRTIRRTVELLVKKDTRQFIRFLFKQLLELMAQRGFIRHKSATAVEFSLYAKSKSGSNEFEESIDLLTDAYVRARYSEGQLDKSTTKSARDAFSCLKNNLPVPISARKRTDYHRLDDM